MDQDYLVSLCRRAPHHDLVFLAVHCLQEDLVVLEVLDVRVLQADLAQFLEVEPGNQVGRFLLWDLLVHLFRGILVVQMIRVLQPVPCGPVDQHLPADPGYLSCRPNRAFRGLLDHQLVPDHLDCPCVRRYLSFQVHQAGQEYLAFQALRPDLVSQDVLCCPDHPASL